LKPVFQRHTQIAVRATALNTQSGYNGAQQKRLIDYNWAGNSNAVWEHSGDK